MRLISICPSNTELAAYIGLNKHIVGVDDFSDWPYSITNLPRLGPDLSIDMEKVEALKPDLVLASLSVPGMERNIEELKKRNIPYIVFNPQSLADIAKDLLTLGKYTNRSEQAKAIVERYNKFISEYKKISKEIVSKPSLYWEWWPKPIFTPGGGNWLTQISELAGAKNLFSDYTEASLQKDWDDVLNENPDYICLAWVGVQQSKMKPELIKKRPGWDKLPAVQNNHIYTLEEELYCRPSPRLLLGLKKLAATIHPDKFPMNDHKDPLLYD